MPKKGKNVIRYKPGSRLLKLNSVIYANFEFILLLYSKRDSEIVKTKKLNMHVPCDYSINAVNYHTKETKQTCYRGESAVSTFCKEIREIALGTSNTE